MIQGATVCVLRGLRDWNISTRMTKRKHSNRPQPANSTPRNPKPPSSHKSAETLWLYGRHAVEAALANPAREKLQILATSSAARSLTGGLAPQSLQPVIVDPQEITRHLPPGAVHQGLAVQVRALAEPQLEEICAKRSDSKQRIVVLLDQVSDPHNVGAILRSCAAFGALALIVTDRNAPQATGALAKAASGALDIVPLLHVVNLARTLDQLAELGFWRVGLDSEAEQPIGNIDLSSDIAIVLGAEGQGIRQLTARKCDFLARLPTGPGLASLNVSNAAAVMLYEIIRRQSSH